MKTTNRRYLGAGGCAVIGLESIDRVVDEDSVDALYERRIVNVASGRIGELAAQQTQVLRVHADLRNKAPQ